ncbi:hypothetical protein [Anaerotignum propionicum]|uniref:hypothetical protein n=1 Tax=Anaerotignum propionicum TaxID=28446 RepID=UPI0021097204|nr:hypothetical protein [Anaerotignum propionicum]MCQ4936328.1 hypothetical protein [Anaerotignum propionicum]
MAFAFKISCISFFKELYLEYYFFFSAKRVAYSIFRSINPHIPKELFSLSITTVIMEMFRWWLDQEKYSEEETAHIFIELLINGFTELAK